jgi:hypothetical protein
MIVLLDTSTASGSVLGKVISSHPNHELAQKAMQDYKHFAYSVGIRPMVSVVMTKVDLASGDPVSVNDLVDEPVERPRMVYIRKTGESQDFGRMPI